MMELAQHIETFVDVSRSPSHQAASLDSIVSLVKKDVLTIGKLVGEMELYLTTTDNVIRARGILLLAEVLKGLESKQLDDATIHSLVGFFAGRLADWRTLRGALLGCLALMKRKSSMGAVTATDAHVVGKSHLQNLQVQSLGQSDRKLCFELLECLIKCYPQSVVQLGDTLVSGVCEAMDGEKDPHCLMLAFRIVAGLAQLFPDPSGPVATHAAGLFENLACYFPLHFTRSRDEEVDVKRDELSRELMLAFSSSPFFEPFAIPLLLEKLSSSLPLAKLDSLKYLNVCASKYGADRMGKHAGALWSSLKDVIYCSSDSVLSLDLEWFNGPCSPENEIVKEALDLLRNLVLQNTSFLAFVLEDTDINKIFETIAIHPIYENMPLQIRHDLFAASQVISLAAKASVASCNGIFRRFFPPLEDILGLSGTTKSGDHSFKQYYTISTRLNQGALYLCTELLASSRDLALGSTGFSLSSDCAPETWFSMLKNCLAQLAYAFVSAATSANEGADEADVYLGVKGLQILGTFPRGYSLISKSDFEKILTALISIITKDFDKMLVWKLSVIALVTIGSFISQHDESEKALSYMGIVIDKAVSLTSPDTSSLHFPLKLEAIAEICTSGPMFMSKVFRELKEALCAQLAEFHVHGSAKAADKAAQLLECFSYKLLPRTIEMGGLEELCFQFAIGIWNHIEDCLVFNGQIQEKVLINSAMMSMKLAVSHCSVEIQNIIARKAYDVLSSSDFQLKESVPRIGVTQETLELNIPSRDDWILSLFASVIVAACPQVHIQNLESVLHTLVTTSLQGHVPAAHALGSLVNKLDMGSTQNNASCYFCLEEALEMILKPASFSLNGNHHPEGSSGTSNAYEAGLMNLSRGVVGSLPLQIHAINTLAWIGKGLLMRGHGELKDVTMVFLERLVSEGKKGTLLQVPPQSSSKQNLDLVAKKCAADAFQVLMGDSDECLNYKFHAVIRPLYKQRFFSMMNPILQSSVMNSDSLVSRQLLYRAYAHIVINTPLIAMLDNAKKLIPMMLACLASLRDDIRDKDVLFELLLVLSGILTSENGQEDVTESAHIIINCLINLIGYPHTMRVRETAIQCLVPMADLPPRRIYPMRTQVLHAVSKALDDPKRNVRREAVRCRHAWSVN